NPGTDGHGKTPPKAMRSAIHWEGNEPGAQTGRPDDVRSVREVLGGAPSSAAFSCVVFPQGDWATSSCQHVLTELPVCPPTTGLSDWLPGRWARSRAGPIAAPGLMPPTSPARAGTRGAIATRT